MTVQSNSVEIRDGRLSDAAELAQLHVDVWRQTYRDLATPKAYEALGVERRLPYWTSTLQAEDPFTRAFVASDPHGLFGVVSIGTPRDEVLGPHAEIKHLYVRQSHQGSGIGAALLRHALDHLSRLNVPSVALAVVEENAAARKFYRRMGGIETGQFTDPGPLWRSRNIVVHWDL